MVYEQQLNKEVCPKCKGFEKYGTSRLVKKGEHKCSVCGKAIPQPPLHRVFNGKRFTLQNRAQNNKEAIYIKSVLKAEGKQVRVIPYQRLHLIYVRNRYARR